MKSRGISNNSYSTLSAMDVEIQWQQYELLLSRKQKLLEEDIEFKKLRGISPDDYRQFDRNFLFFNEYFIGKYRRTSRDLMSIRAIISTRKN